MTFIIDGTTGIATVDGSVSAPSQRGQDNNTGISYASDTIRFSTNGVERMSITNSGVTGAGGGKILQVVQHQFTTGQFSTTSNSYVDVTGFSKSITPVAASSKILAMLNPAIQSVPNGTYNGGTAALLARSVAGGSYTNIGAAWFGIYIQESYARYHDGYVNINVLDSPTYTLGEAITYKMQVKTSDSSVTGYVNINSGGINGLASRLILIEVGA